MKKNILKNMEWSILICSVILLAIGMVALFSATQNANYDELKKQILWFGISIPVMIIVILINYNLLARFSYIFYIIFIGLLIGVLFTEPINGATSWYTISSFTFQPAEFAKIFVIIFLAYVITLFQQKGKEQINKIWKLGTILLVTIIPVLLIIKQPDYGTAIAYLIATVLILYAAGINKKYIIGAIIVVVITLPLLYFFVLPEHAKTRIQVFFDPYEDPRGAGYNVLQSKLAIGAGKVFGMGLLQGNQTQLGYLYPKTTDFIFSVIGEEMGFIVAGAVIVLYVILITKSIQVAKTAKDDLGSYIAIGITGIFIFHMVENIGMTMGLLPITGVPLPFVSYGGSSLLTNFICIGLLLNISSRRQKTIFMQ